MHTIEHITELDPSLFRCGVDDTDLRWSHIGPHHKRAYFNLIDLVGYASKNNNDAPPYRIYNPYEWKGEKVVDNAYATIPAAKRAGRALVMRWLKSAGHTEVVWSQCTPAHFVAHADGLRIASYYYWPKLKAEHPGFHVGFRAHFGVTYYSVKHRNPEEAKAAIAQTWRNWIALAKRTFLTDAAASATGKEGE